MVRQPGYSGITQREREPDVPAMCLLVELSGISS